MIELLEQRIVMTHPIGFNPTVFGLAPGAGYPFLAGLNSVQTVENAMEGIKFAHFDSASAGTGPANSLADLNNPIFHSANNGQGGHGNDHAHDHNDDHDEPEGFNKAFDGTWVKERESTHPNQTNNTVATAQHLQNVGTSPGNVSEITILGSLGVTAREISTREDDGSIQQANPTGLRADRDGAIIARGRIGDGPHGNEGTGFGDYDYDYDNN